MGQARRKQARPAQRARRALRAPPVASQGVLPDNAVDRILDPRLGHAGGDPVAGICYATLGGAAIWTLLALILL
jgi:hypothetical protein